jgi:hypothetical protein
MASKVVKSLIIGGLVLMGFRIPDEGKLKVELPLNEWQKGLNYLEVAKSQLKASNLPVNQVLPLVDSLSYLEDEIVKQLRVQITDTTKSHGK